MIDAEHLRVVRRLDTYNENRARQVYRRARFFGTAKA